MSYPQITTYTSLPSSGHYTFYILSKGLHAGKPNLTPWVNCFAVHCTKPEELDFYFWLCYALYQTGRFKQYLRGSVIPFITVKDARKALQELADAVYPHWQHLQGVIEALNKLKTARAHLAQCIIANEKLQTMLLQIHF